MKLVVSSDYHLDHVTHGVSRFEEIASAAHKTVDVAIAQRADLWVFLGDAMDPDSGSCVFRCVEVMFDLIGRLKRARVAAVLISGNHCVLEDGSGDTTLSPLRATADGESIRVIEHPEAFTVAGRWFVCFPFTASSHRYEPVAHATTFMKPGAITLSHLSVPGIIPGEETTEMPRGREVMFPIQETSMAAARLQGHFHRRQSFDPKDGGPPIQIPGSLARLTFNEETHTPGFLLVDL